MTGPRPRAPRGPARWPIAVLAGGFVAAGVAGLVGNPFDEEFRALRIVDPPAAYRIVYRVENLAGGARLVNTERVLVRRPFESRVIVRRGAPPGGEIQSVTVNRLGLLATSSPRSQTAVLVRRAGPPDPDVRLDAVLADALDGGVVSERRERRRVLGRACDVYRVPADTRGGRDVCVDARGLVLEEEEISGGRVLRRRSAVALALDPAVPEGSFDVEGDPVPPELGGGVFAELGTEAEPPEDFETVRRAPSGFRFAGRFRSVIGTGEGGPLEVGGGEASIYDLFVRGRDYVAVETVAAVGPSAAEGEDTTVGRALGTRDLRGARVVTTIRSNEVRLPRDGAMTIRVGGTLPLDDLVEIAASVRSGR